MLRLLLFFWFFAITCSYGQIAHGGSPLPFSSTRSVPIGFFEEMPGFDIEEQLRLDSLEFGSLRTSNRFAYKFITDFTPTNSGINYTLADGTKVWRVGIYSPGARSLNLLFTEYELPEGARLFLYDAEQHQVRGAFNSQNNSERGILPVSPIAGERIIVEYQEPAHASFHARLRIGEVNHAYRDLPRLAEPASEPYYSVSCIPALVCSVAEGDPYAEIGKSVVELIIDGMYYCTGSLVNNTLQDGTPYLLTASHCLNRNFSLRNPDYEEIAGRIVAFFNYESPTCPSTMRGTEEMSLASAYCRAIYERTDLALLEFQDMPPVYYRPFYAGWNATERHTAPYVSIQHPQGTTKRFSLTNYIERRDVQIAEQTFDTNSFWYVPAWETGCTAPGSSGSPLFDADHRIVGVLTGGNSSCTSPSDDFYYALVAAWSPSDEPSKQLKHWLTSGDGKETLCNGLNPYGESSAIRLSHILDNGWQEDIETARDANDHLLFGLNETSATEYAEQYTLPTPAVLYGCYIVTPAISGRTYPEVEICVYSGNERPETLLTTQRFSPKIQYIENDTLTAGKKSLSRAQEHFVAFDEPLSVSGNLFVSYRINDENTSFCAYNIPQGKTTANSAWIHADDTWLPATQHPSSSFATSLFIDPVLAYSDERVTPNESPLVSDLRLISEPYTHTLHLVLPLDAYPAEFTLHSMRGEQIDRQTLSNEQATFSYPQLSAGIYIVSLQINGERKSQKVIFY